MSKPWIHALSLLIALGSLGWIVGWFVGQSGSEATVLAAVLPAVLSLGGGLLIFKFATQREKEDRLHGIAANTSVVLFIIFLFIGSLQGFNYKLIVDNDSLVQRFELCSDMELSVNESRKLLKLPPLKSEVFCK